MFQNIISRFDPMAGTLQGGTLVTRRLSDLRGIFADEEAYRKLLAGDDPVVYTVESIEPGDGDGDLHYGIGRIMPGRIGDE
ncbi:MAG: glucose-6-phosphate isomerase family protein, partial [Bacteroidota bacterium]